MMAQAMFIYFGSAALFNINMGMWQAAFFIVSINTGAYMAETVRGGILSIDPGQTEGAKAIGMTHFQTMMNVHTSSGIKKHYASDRQQPYYQYQGYMCTFGNRYR